MLDITEKHISKVGVDVGGTFTDLFSYDAKGRTTLRAKVFSTPDNYTTGVIRAILDSGVDVKKIDYLIHGSTIATNSAIERTYPITPFITTKGFRDFILIGRYHRRFLFDPYQKKPEPLVKRRYIFEVTERLNSSGEVIEPLNISEVESIARKIIDLGVKSVAVGLLNSYANPINEEKIKTLIKQLNPNIFVSLSSTIPKFRALKRFTTAVIRACLQPVVKNYLESLYNRLKEKRFQGRFMVVTNNGGMIDAKVAIERPELMLTSGPASGVNAAMFISEGLGIKDSITMDMGGTSCDVSIIEKAQPLVTSEYELDFDIPVSVPMLDIRAIGAGGGSIAWIDEGGSLKVGPRSAGSFPGPACYARGGFQPTVTDANLLLGRINKRQMFGKEVQLDIKASEKAIKTLSHQVDLDLIQTADGILTIVNENMASALKQVSLDRGRDPRDFCLVAFGGAGPMHAAFLAKTMNINKVIIPRDAGILSAFGGIVMDFKHGFEKTLYCPINNVDYVSLNKRYHELGQKALESIVQQGIHKKNIKVNRSAQMRFVGQTYEVETPIPDGKIGPKEIETIRINFYNEHEKEYGLADRELPVAFVNLRSTAIGKVQKPSFEVSHIENEATENIQVVVRSVYFKDYGFTETEVFDRRFLATGFRVKGPAILEDDMSTTVIAPEMIAEIDGYGNIIIFSKLMWKGG